jgi:hypothetical protein
MGWRDHRRNNKSRHRPAQVVALSPPLWDSPACSTEWRPGSPTGSWGAELNAADFMVAPSMALILYRPDLMPLVEGRPYAWFTVFGRCLPNRGPRILRVGVTVRRECSGSKSATTEWVAPAPTAAGCWPAGQALHARRPAAVEEPGGRWDRARGRDPGALTANAAASRASVSRARL